MGSPQTINSTSLVLPGVVQIILVHVVFLVDLCVLLLVVLRVLGYIVLRVLLSYCECCCTVSVLLYFALDAGLLARSQHSEGPATGHLDTSFSWFPYI